MYPSNSLKILSSLCIWMVKLLVKWYYNAALYAKILFVFHISSFDVSHGKGNKNEVLSAIPITASIFFLFSWCMCMGKYVCGHFCICMHMPIEYAYVCMHACLHVFDTHVFELSQKSQVNIGFLDYCTLYTLKQVASGAWCLLSSFYWLSN